MSFNSLERVLESLRILERSPTQQQLQILNKSWSELLGQFADYSCPITIERHTLYIATVSPTLAQEMTLQSMDILNKVNQLLPTPIKKIHFSTAQWPQKPFSTIQAGQTESLHPSLIPKELVNKLDTSNKQNKPSNNALEQFKRWQNILQQRSNSLPLCPQCQAPTPPGELARWSICAICMGQNQQKQEKSTNFIDYEIDF